MLSLFDNIHWVRVSKKVRNQGNCNAKKPQQLLKNRQDLHCKTRLHKLTFLIANKPSAGLKKPLFRQGANMTNLTEGLLIIKLTFILARFKASAGNLGMAGILKPKSLTNGLAKGQITFIMLKPLSN